MNKRFSKILIAFILIGLNGVAILVIGDTQSSFSDTKIITNNVLQAGVLDLTQRSGQNNFVPEAENMLPGGQVNRDIYLGKTASSLDLQHQVSFEFIDGDIDLCQQFDLKIWYDHYHGPKSGGYANRDMRLVYDDKLAALSNYHHSDFSIPHLDDQFDADPSDGTEQWFYYSIIVPENLDNSYQNKICHFQFIFDGWQVTLPDFSQGFTDTEAMKSVIMMSDWSVPTIENVESIIATPAENNELKAIISWETDELATSNVDWGVDISYGQSAPLTKDTTADNFLHSVEISGLSSQMIYHFRVRSKDMQGNEVFSTDYVFQTDGSKISTGLADVVINEFLPDPMGDDSATMPSGEWVEFYNKGNQAVDLGGWSLTNSLSEKIYIDGTNTASGNTVIPALGFLVVYINGQYTDWLNNNADTINFYTDQEIVSDFYLYDASLGDIILENKSFARIPDGGDIWYDPIPTPGLPNELSKEEEDELESLLLEQGSFLELTSDSSNMEAEIIDEDEQEECESFKSLNDSEEMDLVNDTEGCVDGFEEEASEEDANEVDNKNTEEVFSEDDTSEEIELVYNGEDGFGEEEISEDANEEVISENTVSENQPLEIESDNIALDVENSGEGGGGDVVNSTVNGGNDEVVCSESILTNENQQQI